MPQVKISIPDSQLDAEARKRIKQLERQLAAAETKYNKLKAEFQAIEKNVRAAQRVQDAFKNFSSIVADELNLDYDQYAGRW